MLDRSEINQCITASQKAAMHCSRENYVAVSVVLIDTAANRSGTRWRDSQVAFLVAEQQQHYYPCDLTI